MLRVRRSGRDASFDFLLMAEMGRKAWRTAGDSGKSAGARLKIDDSEENPKNPEAEKTADAKSFWSPWQRYC
jgi:hypothetical protein